MAPIRVLVVDDSVVVRRLVTDVLSADPDIDVVASAANGLIALRRLDSIEVDVITLDIEMPELDGIGTLKQLRLQKRRTPVIMFSTLTERGAQMTLDALAAGASDYVTKPSNMGSVAESRESVRAQLIPKIKGLAGRRAPAPARTTVAAAPAARPAPRPAGSPVTTPRAVVLGCSTGGPEALAQVLNALPADFPVPILVVQHMPPVFTKMFAERLDRSCPLRVIEATSDLPVRPGTVYVAPGDFHMEVVPSRLGVRGEATTRLQSNPPENFCRPAVDVLFRSAAAVYGGALLAVVLTGMGSDGRVGSTAIRAANGRVIVQDRETSVVWGMPGSVAEHGLADEVLPLAEIAGAMVRSVKPPAARPSPDRTLQPAVRT